MDTDTGLDKRQQRRARRRAALTPPDNLTRLLTDGRYMTRSWKRAMAAATKRHARLIERACSQGRCIELIDPDTGENTGGWGPVNCACQDEDTPGGQQRAS